MSVSAQAAVRRGVSPLRVVLAILWRDAVVTWRDIISVLAQVVLQPLVMLFIFVGVLGRLAYVDPSYDDVLLPGVVAMSGFVAALQAVALPLMMEFGYTKEIEDRLLAPVPISLVGLEKVLAAALRALFAAAVTLPAGMLIVQDATFRVDGLPLLVLSVLLGGWAAGAIGLIIGTLLPPSKVGIMFALIIAPMLFTGGTQYPWPSLGKLPWFQVLTALNPMTYASEGVRAALEPQVPHIEPWISMVVLTGSCVVLTAIGMVSFRRRSLT
ncbi:ABC transporter permease [Nonomuraea aurantiaca]|uniref:ABC transporter permease n=1 Tax=Nonomuraea aurantiaca TaxID=2878562 RepID=UPI001CD9B97B|nr:ABC transporter permease [Nonomuraea aurantiaca]MCA2226459.1 ABC transporter permease [Nonomuraea aurantiaca]